MNENSLKSHAFHQGNKFDLESAKFLGWKLISVFIAS